MVFLKGSVPEIIDPVFAKTNQNARFLLSENERFGLVFVKTVSINSGTAACSLDLTMGLLCLEGTSRGIIISTAGHAFCKHWSWF